MIITLVILWVAVGLCIYRTACAESGMDDIVEAFEDLCDYVNALYDRVEKLEHQLNPDQVDTDHEK